MYIIQCNNIVINIIINIVKHCYALLCNIDDKYYDKISMITCIHFTMLEYM